ncbi:MAG: glycosyltransferase family 4 protein [Candidatus Eisenbacteria bacterium]
MSGAPLRVAHVVASTGRSGVESYLRALLPSFKPAQVQARVFVPGPGPLVDALHAHGVTAEPGAPASKFAWGEARTLAARLHGQCDILHAHGPRAAFWSAQVAEAARIPGFVCTVHELRWLSLPPGPRRALWVAFESWALARADRLVVLSHDSETRVRERFPQWAARLVRVPSSTPLLLDDRTLPRAHPGSPETPLRVVAIGRFDWVKRHDRLLDAVAIAARRGIALELHLAGDGPLAPALREQAHRLGILDRLHWPGANFDVPALLASGHVFATASHTETFGIAALEAMAVGLPVVTCDNGGVSELVLDGDCGHVVRERSDPGAAQGLAEALMMLASDPARRARLGESAARRAREHYSPEAMARATTAVYAQAMRG